MEVSAGDSLSLDGLMSLEPLLTDRLHYLSGGLTGCNPLEDGMVSLGGNPLFVDGGGGVISLEV